MKWFFALSANTITFSFYSEMIKVAVLSARKYTSLEPNFLYNSSADDDLVRWLRGHGVTIWYRPSFLENELKRIAEQQHKPHIFSIGSGAFLRCEIPELLHENIFDEFVLYTDCDVMFLADVEDLLKYHPSYFSIAPESNRNNYRRANTGVMLMNVNRLYQENNLFRNYLLKNIDKLVTKTWDQGAYLSYYQSGRFLKKPLWDRLPPQYNWKTYWGDFSNAKIIHFHGLKPFQHESLRQRKLPRELLKIKSPEYYALVDIYYNWLSQS